MTAALQAIRQHQAGLVRCRRCPGMTGPPVHGEPVISPVMLIGQAPGAKEIEARRPFAWTAGRTQFKWFEGIGLPEEQFRKRVYMAAVCRCFPGKRAAGGDRLPDREEIANCASWLDAELDLLRPRLVIPTGKLAMGLFLPADRLDAVVGQMHRITAAGRECDLVPLPHPSGASTWHRVEPGKTLLRRALGIIARHPAWQAILGGGRP